MANDLIIMGLMTNHGLRVKRRLQIARFLDFATRGARAAPFRLSAGRALARSGGPVPEPWWPSATPGPRGVRALQGQEDRAAKALVMCTINNIHREY